MRFEPILHDVMKKTAGLLTAAFPAERAKWLVSAQREAYLVNIERYKPSIGDDAMNFGLNVYKSKVYFISQLAERYDWIEVLQKNPFFRFRIDDYFISAYCAGHEDDLKPEESFPNNRNRAGKLVDANTGQLLIPAVAEWGRDVRDRFDDSSCDEIILNDIGNAMDGLIRSFIGVPIAKTEDNRIKGWSTIHELWNRDDEQFAIPPFGPTTPPENITRFRPTLKEKPQEDTEE